MDNDMRYAVQLQCGVWPQNVISRFMTNVNQARTHQIKPLSRSVRTPSPCNQVTRSVSMVTVLVDYCDIVSYRLLCVVVGEWGRRGRGWGSGWVDPLFSWQQGPVTWHDWFTMCPNELSYLRGKEIWNWSGVLLSVSQSESGHVQSPIHEGFGYWQRKCHGLPAISKLVLNHANPNTQWSNNQSYSTRTPKRVMNTSTGAASEYKALTERIII